MKITFKTEADEEVSINRTDLFAVRLPDKAGDPGRIEMRIPRLEAMRLIEWATRLDDEDFETKRYNQDEEKVVSNSNGAYELDKSIH